MNNTMTRQQRRQLDLKHFPGLRPLSIAGLLFLYIPILVTCAYAFNGGTNALIWEGFSLRWFSEVFQDGRILDATWVSLQVAVIATASTTVLSILYVLGMGQLGRRSRRYSGALLNASLVIPEIVLAVATLSFIRIIGLSTGFLALVLAHTAFCIPFSLMTIRSRMRSLGTQYFEAAADLGASGWQLFRRVTLPLLMPAITSGALLSFVISMDDFLISNFLSSAGTTTLPVYLYGLIRKGPSPEINVIAVLLLMLAVFVTAVTFAQSKGNKK